MSGDRQQCFLPPSLHSKVCPSGVRPGAFGVPPAPRGQGRCLRSGHSQRKGPGDLRISTSATEGRLPGSAAGRASPCGLGRERKTQPHLRCSAFKVRVKCDTPAKREQKKHPSTRPSSSPPPFSMETHKRRRSGVCYGKVSPWSETVSGVSAGSELPVSGEGRRQAGRSLATYTCIFFFFPLDLILFHQHVSPPLLPLPLQVDRLK